ncbi:MAG: glycosyltransferase [Candidatus Peribacteraceae bacterium]|nr:glycosyltransferase [Candidatus Peribacteraceae bacterium]
MRIAYCTTLRLPSDRARSYQVAKVAEALQENGHSVHIFTPWADDGETVTSVYGLSTPLSIERLGMRKPGGADAFFRLFRGMLTIGAFRRALKRTLTDRRNAFDLIYTNTPELLPELGRIGLPVILELRHMPKRLSARFITSLKRCRLVVVLTSALRQALVDGGLVDIPVIVESDGVDLQDFETTAPIDQTRASLGVRSGVPLLTFVGTLMVEGHSRGIPEMLVALDILRKRGLAFRSVIAGGPPDVAERLNATVPDGLTPMLTFLGLISRLQVPSLLAASDVLLFPAPDSDHPFFLQSFSPLQLFEYLASGRPSLVPDLPPLRDIADESLVTFYPSGSSEGLAKAIRLVLDDPEGARKKAGLARAHIAQFSWQRRMERVVGAMGG